MFEQGINFMFFFMKMKNMDFLVIGTNVHLS